ncbi:histidinol-phosphate transaminase [Thermostilla marina]
MNFRKTILSMAGYTPGEQPQDGRYIKLNTNENPYPASPKVFEAIRAVLEGGLQKYPDALATPFRIAASKVLGVDPDWILAGNGSDDILTIVTRAFVEAGDVVRYPRPSYVLYSVLAELQSARSEEVPFTADWRLDDSLFDDTERLRLVYLPNPNSPTGTLIPPEEILALADRLPCPLLVDEAYVDFADTNCLDLVARNEKILVSRTLSKSYALAGLRFGFLVAQPHVIEQLRKVKDSYNCDALSIAGAAAAIEDQRWLADNRRKILATRKKLSVALTALGFTLTDSHANFVWATRNDRPVQPIYEELKRRRILVRYMNYEGYGDGLRITVGTDDEIDTLLSELEDILASST